MSREVIAPTAVVVSELSGTCPDTTPSLTVMEDLLEVLNEVFSQHVSVAFRFAAEQLKKLEDRAETCGCHQCRIAYQNAVERFACEWGCPPAEDREPTVRRSIPIRRS